MTEDPHQAGMQVRREVLGDEHVDRAIADTTDLDRPFQEFITRYAWGSVWTRGGLDRRTRSAITLAILTALGREHELAMHIRGARTNGLTPEEIGEVLLHTAVYAGVPAANAAFAIASGPSPTNPQQTHREPNAEARTAAGDARTRDVRRDWSGREAEATPSRRSLPSSGSVVRQSIGTSSSRPRRRTRRKRAPLELGHSCLVARTSRCAA
jgi:4-carboxymuconolactone decarboxylase